jgi:hypothetical protein
LNKKRRADRKLLGQPVLFSAASGSKLQEEMGGEQGDEHDAASTYEHPSNPAR